MAATLTAGGITFSNSTTTTTNLIPTGALICSAFSTAPSGFFYCNGQAVSRTTYSVLFGRIGTTFGVGDGSTTFNVPDFRGEFIRGWDDARGVDSGRTFGSFQATSYLNHGHNVTAESADHNHDCNTYNVSADHSHYYEPDNDGNRAVTAGGGTCNQGDTVTGTTGIQAGQYHFHGFGTYNVSADHGHNIISDGTVESRPRNYALSYFIKF
jgi:microcystin-dependent protein